MSRLGGLARSGGCCTQSAFRAAPVLPQPPVLPRRRKALEGGKQFKLRQELTSYLGDPDINFAKVAEAFSVKAEVISAPGEIRSAFERAIQANRDGQPYLIDALVERRGILAESTWHSPFTIAGLRQ